MSSVTKMPAPNEAHDAVYGATSAWTDLWRRRNARVAAGRLDPKLRHLVFVAGHFINGYRAGLEEHRREAMRHGAVRGDFVLMLQFLDFYRGLRLFQDAQQIVGLWRTGNFPEVKAPETGSVSDIHAQIVASRKYIANGFRVYSADGEWLRMYLERSDTIKTSPSSLDERGVQLVAFAATLMNHRHSSNWNDGCVQSHETKTVALGTTQEELLEVVQILELCESARTAAEGAMLLDGLEA